MSIADQKYIPEFFPCINHYPEFSGLNYLSKTYLCDLLEPFHDEIARIDDIGLLLDWVCRIIPEGYSDLVFTSMVSINQARLDALAYLGDLLIESARSQVEASIRKRDKEHNYGPPVKKYPSEYLTPWDLSTYRNKLTTRIFGPGCDKLEFTILNKNGKYSHKLSEEFTYGMLIVLQDDHVYGVLLNNTLITHCYKVFDPKYLDADFNTTSRYVIVVRIGIEKHEIRFNSVDFIDGIISASLWIGQNPKKILVNFTDSEIKLYQSRALILSN